MSLFILFLIFCMSIYFFVTKKRKCMVPKVIYGFWESDRPNKIIDECIQTWYKHNPNWKIILLNNSNVNEYAPESLSIPCNSIQQFTDFVRLEILSKYGGVWLDVSIYMNTSLDNILKNYTQYELIGFKNPIRRDTYVMENWFIASTKTCVFIQKWKEDFFKLRHVSIEEYLSYIPERYKKDVEDPMYLAQNVSWNYCFHQFPNLRHTIYLFPSHNGPFKLQWMAKWDSLEYKRIYPLLKETIKPFIKLTHNERNAIMN